MRERRGTMPGLNLISEDNLYLAFVSTTDFDPRLYDLIDGNRKLAANRTGDCVQNRRASLRDNTHLKGQT